MSEEFAIEAASVGKRYRIGDISNHPTNIREAVYALMAEPFNRLRAVRHGYLPAHSQQEFWALRDVSFKIKPGESVGLIGVNGSGKSTLLKILANVVEPNEGSVKTVGVVGSLIEVGAGFHPELTGRENAYLNATIFGMTAKEIDEKFDSIVDFADIRDFIDTPFKRYSSGMRIRLGFSVAIHIDPDILLVDEVFAVGDVRFREMGQRKIEEMRDAGKTVIVVSHTMAHIQRLCDRAIWLEQGRLIADGDVDEVASEYLDVVMGPQREQDKRARDEKRQQSKAEAEAQASAENNKTIMQDNRDSQQEVSQNGKPPEPPKPKFVKSLGKFIMDVQPDKPMCIREVLLSDEEGNLVDEIDISQPFYIRVKYDINEPVRGHLISFISSLPSNNRVVCIGDADVDPLWREKREVGSYHAELCIPAWTLNTGLHAVTITLGIPYDELYDRQKNVIDFEVVDSTTNRGDWYTKGPRPGVLGIDLPWRYIGNNPVSLPTESIEE